MHAEVSRIVFWAAMAGQYIFGFICAAALLRALLIRKPRWMHVVSTHWQKRLVPDRLLHLLGMNRAKASFTEREALLTGIGFTGDPAIYVLARTILLAVLPCAAAGLYFLSRLASEIAAYSTVCYTLIGLGAAIVFWDGPWLEALKNMRTQRMIKEIYIISNQLLYLSGSSLNIHAKLMRCLPYTRALRGDLQRLLGEWYHDADGALRRFKQRIGTEEGLSFVETITSLRLHESEEYYRLLRERIQDYKEKIDLAKESRKESASYVLFILAGVPILYMFQIFIYPWVQEGQKLFQSLNP
ncbi:hypothetical protein [Paenibacillus abyssi]|uniref:Uncharacterized protein n=1 Tax=Paenibacillus abyssi TaxID=1340531 RepID=A0A917D5A5_9BACL|nr:hypothetical protein [Paenibacillus abyssi]GGG09180.1 hypothetical protein GCM10010916_27540 [Paenibacillus abyssi]